MVPGSFANVEERSSYWLLDTIGNPVRNALTLLLFASGYCFQLYAKNLLAGLPFIVGCVLLNVIRNVKIDPVRATSAKWEEVTPAKIAEVRDHCERVGRFAGRDWGCLVVVVMVFVVIIINPLIIRLVTSGFPILAIALDSVILFVALVFGGRRSAWTPPGLLQKTNVVKRMLEHELIKSTPGMQAIPYLEIGTSGKRTFPKDARIMFRFKDAPASFIGVQGQVSINNVKSSVYPYFYTVIIARPEFHLFDKVGSPELPGLTVEKDTDGEVEVVVIRQTTTKTSGYHTDAGAQDLILTQAIAVAKRILAPQPHQ